MSKRIRNKRLTIMFTNKELNRVKAQMAKCGFTNFSAFARRMLTGGLVVNVDMRPLERALPLIHEEGMKINQIVKELNFGTNGTTIDAFMPPVRRFGGGGDRASIKQRIIDRLMEFYERYFGM